MNENKYSESDIQVLEGLEAVRKRPGMYIGSTDLKGLHHLIWEVFDNSVDEVLANFADLIRITLHKDQSISISDNGRGIPVGKHPKTGISTVETVFTILHAGGKFGEGAYKTAGGLHGVGASVVNALSEWLKVEVYKDGKSYEVEFKNGGQVNKALHETGATRKKGTFVHFKPDPKIFKEIEFNADTIVNRIKESAFLLKGLKVIFINELAEEDEEKETTFFYENGLAAYVKYINDGKESLHEPIMFEGSSETIEVEIAIQYTDTYQETIVGFANNVKTAEGGTHINGLKIALGRAINQYASNQGLIKEKEKLEGVDCREGVTAIVSVRIPENLIQYEGQTKGKLGTAEARNAVDSVVSDSLYFWLMEHKAEAHNIVNKIIGSRKARDAARKARLASREAAKKGPAALLLSGKLTPAQSRKPAEKELYLVEGDSAGGSAKLGRDRKFQAILPLRGKVINSEKAKLDDLLKNEEISTIINTIGAGFGNDFELDVINYHKIIIMTDADTDGAHIQVLLLTFFFRYMRPLIDAGMIYVALPPLYKITGKLDGKNALEYAWEDHDLDALRSQMKGKIEIQRYKGLGEMNSDQLWETTMNPDSRQLIQITVDDAVLAEKRVTVLMGDDPEARKRWITKHVKFSMDDAAF